MTGLRTGLAAALTAALILTPGCKRDPVKEFNKNVKFVGFDSTKPLLEAIKSDRLHAVVVQNPVKMGYLGVTRIVADIRDKAKLETYEDTGLVLVTKADLDKPATKELLNPDLSILEEKQEPTPVAGKVLRIAVIPKGTSHEFWKSIHAGARKAAKELGGVEIIWQGPAKEDDTSEQVRLVNTLAGGRLDGIVLAPLNEDALAGPVAAAAAEGIPVVVIDSGLKGDKHLSTVASDNYRGGVLAAREMARLLAGKGRVVMLRYSAGHESTGRREAGFKDTLTKEFPDISLVNDVLYAGATAGEAKVAGGNLLDLAPDVDGVFTPNESSTYGMLQALDERR